MFALGAADASERDAEALQLTDVDHYDKLDADNAVQFEVSAQASSLHAPPQYVGSTKCIPSLRNLCTRTLLSAFLMYVVLCSGCTGSCSTTASLSTSGSACTSCRARRSSSPKI